MPPAGPTAQPGGPSTSYGGPSTPYGGLPTPQAGPFTPPADEYLEAEQSSSPENARAQAADSTAEPVADYSMPALPSVPEPTTLTGFVTGELESLKTATTENVWTRAGLLTALSERIRVHLTRWQPTPDTEPARQTLANLSATLAVPTSDPTEIDRRWHQALTTLESLTTKPKNPRRTFWKR